MFSFLPKETAFFDLFDHAAANIQEGARLLVDLLDHFETLPEKAKQIKEVEHAGDEITHQTIEKLNKTFITSLEREDIHQLICRLDDILDFIDVSVNRMLLYKVAKPTEDAKLLAKVLQRSAEIIREALKCMRNLKKSDRLLLLCIDLHTQENEGDRIEQHALAELFNGSGNAIEIIKWKDIYEDLERATDRCEDVANIMESIVLKQG